MNNKLTKILLEISNNNDLFQKYVNNNPSFLLENFLLENPIRNINATQMKIYLQNHKEQKNVISNELNIICEYDKLLIGIKGFFLESEYYKDNNEKRTYNDIDIVVPSYLFYDFYSFLLRKGYTIIRDHNLFYNNKHLVKILKNHYIEMVHCIDLEKQINTVDGTTTIYVDLHSNLNIGLETTFNMKNLFDNSIKRINSNFEYYEFAPLDYVSFLIVHMIKHLPYINHYNTELSIDIQKIYDIFLVIEKNNINFEEIKENFLKINVMHYFVMFYKIYNDIFIKNQFDYSDIINNCNDSWKFFLKKFVKIPVKNIILGDYENYIPIISKTYRITDKIKNQDIRVIIWKHYMKKIIH